MTDMETNFSDFLGRQLEVGDYVIYTQKAIYGNKPLAYGIVEELGGESKFEEIKEALKLDPNVISLGSMYPRFPCSVVVKRITPRYKCRSKYKDRFPSDAKLLIKVPKEEIMLKILQHGDTNFLKG